MRVFGKGSQFVAVALFFFGFATARAQTLIPPTIAAEMMTNREVRLRLTTSPQQQARIDTSTNLIDWSGFLTMGAGSLTHTDTFAVFTLDRFYRTQTITPGAVTGDHISTTN